MRNVFDGFPSLQTGRAGDPGLFGPGSAVWAIDAHLVTILGGGRALLMQLAHPSVAAGVADHSAVEIDPFPRLWRTLDAVLTVAFGDTDQASRAAGAVTRLHGRVVGEREGRPYRALDPDLLLWVHATLVDTALVVTDTFVGPVPMPLRERFYAEMRRFAAAFGLDVADQPEDLAGFERYLTTAMTGLEIGEDARRLAAPILHPPVPRTLAPVAALLRLVTIGLLPPRLRAGFGLEWSGRRERALRAAASIIRSTRPLMPDVAQKWSHARVAEARSRARRWE